MRRVQYVDRTTSSAEEDNWDYDKIQRIENTKQKRGFYIATLLVNNVSMKFIIDSGSPVSLIPENLFSKITPIEPLKTTYKDVNNQKIDFTGQTKAIVKKRNNGTTTNNYKSTNRPVNRIRLDATPEN